MLLDHWGGTESADRAVQPLQAAEKLCHLQCQPHVLAKSLKQLSKAPDWTVICLQEEIYQAFDDYQRGRLQNPEDNPWTGPTKAEAVAA